MGLEGKVAVVTGAARGLGRATALRLARAGADVAVLDIDLKGGAQFGEELTAATVPDEIRGFGRKSVGVDVDLTDKAAVDAAFAQVTEALGPVDILVNIAGGAITPIQVSTPSKTSLEDAQRNFDVNFTTALLCSQAVIPAMIERKGGTIVNCSSVAGSNAGPGGRLSAYGCSKAAVAHLTRDMALELGEHGIRVNAVAPGLMATSRIKAQAAARGLGTAAEAQNIPLKRLGEPEDIAAAVEYLVGDGASYVTGQVLSVCGGSGIAPN